MKLIIGGAAQGKRAYVKTAYRIAGSELLDGERCPLLPSRAAALDRLHLLVRRALLAGLEDVYKRQGPARSLSSWHYPPPVASTPLNGSPTRSG